MMGTPTFVSLFAGVGGLDLAVEANGFRVVAQVENDPHCIGVLERHWPAVPRYGDVKEIDWHGFLAAHGRPYLVAAGFPCQPTSQAGRRKAQADPRWLWPEVARCLRTLRPPFVFLENTMGLLARGFGDVLGDLAALGFDCEWDCLQAADVGAPHERDRVFVLAWARQWGWTGEEILAYAQRGGREGLHERHEPGHVAADAGERGAAGRGGPADELDGRAVANRAMALAEQPRPQGAATSGAPEGAPRATSAGGAGWRREPRVGGGADGLPAGLDGHRWPAPPGPYQHPWEPPRTVGKGIPNRGRRVKALGNAVVPQQGALAFALLWRRMLVAAALAGAGS